MTRHNTDNHDRAAVTTTTAATRCSRQRKESSKHPRLFYARPFSTIPLANPLSSGLCTKHHLSHLSLFSDIKIPSKLSSAIPLGLGSITFLSALQDYYEVVLSDFLEQGAVNEYSCLRSKSSRCDETCTSVLPYFLFCFFLCTVPKKGRISAGVTHLFLALDNNSYE